MDGTLFFPCSFEEVSHADEEKQHCRCYIWSCPKTALNEIATSLGFSYTFKEQNVTILFIDIIDFSLSSEKMGATKSFTALSGWLNKFIIIEASGGHRQIAGDGFLCFWLQL